MKFNLRILADILFSKNPQILVGKWTIDYDKTYRNERYI
jgi:hypothetical protein